MANKTSFSLVLPSQFIQATRDSGYKGLASAIAELLDNSFEAEATRVDIRIEENAGEEGPEVEISDNGKGMDSLVLRRSLQFGWSWRFNHRTGIGRYGMGLPNSSLSQARRVEVYSAREANPAYWTYIDVDEVVSGRCSTIPHPMKVDSPAFAKVNRFGRGTTVVWKKCDRLKSKRLGLLLNRLHSELGRLFRYQLWDGNTIRINGRNVEPFDPLFERQGVNLIGAASFGPELMFELRIPGVLLGKTSAVRVRFTELPVSEWHDFSNEEKNKFGIAKNAGVSVVRAGREIDNGWFFMGTKRKENYDDWWRCEVGFDPDLDELFGVTHTKQEIHPTEELVGVLTPDIERIARELNSRARKAFMVVKSILPRRPSEAQAQKLDGFFDPPPSLAKKLQLTPVRALRRTNGMEYQLHVKSIEDVSFFVPSVSDHRLAVLLNKDHPFYDRFFGRFWKSGHKGQREVAKFIEFLILAAARAETAAKDRNERRWAKNFRESWSNILAAFLS